MELPQPIRCIHVDPKTKTTTVKFLMPHVAERMRKYGWRVEHVANDTAEAIAVGEVKEVEQKEQVVSEAVEFAQSFDQTPEPVKEKESVSEEPKPKRKYATGKPTKVTNK